jgi:hypothetical protein
LQWPDNQSPSAGCHLRIDPAAGNDPPGDKILGEGGNDHPRRKQRRGVHASRCRHGAGFLIERLRALLDIKKIQRVTQNGNE